ncbi:MAG: galactose-1-phosphate uridylyltransferase [bacterium]
MSELRRDPVLGRWVIISTERGKRPTDFLPAEPHKSSGFCAFCPGNENMTPPEIAAVRERVSLPDTPGWRVRVVSNKYPVLTIEGDLNKRAYGMYDIMNGVGAHEVFIETPDHEQTISTLSDQNLTDLIWMYRERMIDLEKDERFKYILIFRNSGQAGGASLSHPHSQLIATPTVPKRISEELAGSLSYLDFKDRCVFCDMIDEERAFKKRVVEENEDFISFCPFAARFPFEMWLLPKKHSEKFSELKNHMIPTFASCFQRSIRRLDNALGHPPYNYIIHTTPCNTNKTHHYHWHMEIIPRLTQIAGFEWGTGFYINPMSPEMSAETMRNACNGTDKS